ncbi:hypothetical protein fHeYen801_059 [Yersinia phage fHe-Yen8-01]|nr:hypothetical protein fHeYen801_059 [Yersinia phage fHe-Yen8-01]
MKLTAIRQIARYLHVPTGREVNVKTGRNAQRGTDHYFYLRSGVRVYITDAEFHSPLWEKVKK